MDMERNRLNSSIPTETGLLAQLSHLDLQRNVLESSIPSEIGLLTQLVRPDLSTNNLDGSIPTGIIHLTKLTSLYLNGNNLSGDVTSLFCNPSENYESISGTFASLTAPAVGCSATAEKGVVCGCCGWPC